MNVYYLAGDSSLGLCLPASVGMSDAASIVEREVHKGLRDYAEPRIALLASDILQIAVDSTGTEGIESCPIDIDTARSAIEFAYLLPRSLPAPEVAPDPDGDISFDWLGPSGKMFSVSIDAHGRLAYAGRFGDKSKVHGIEQLSDVCPQEVIRGIAKTTR